jgi:hypothetical protein
MTGGEAACVAAVAPCGLETRWRCSEVISRTRGVVEARTTHEREVRCSNPGVSKVLHIKRFLDQF